MKYPRPLFTFLIGMLLLTGWKLAPGAETSEYELWAGNFGRPPTIGQRLGAAVSDFIDNTQDYWRSKELLIREIKSARKNFWDTYPDKPGHAEAAKYFQTVLYTRDLMAMGRALDSDPLSAFKEPSLLNRLQNFVESGGGPDPDGELNAVPSRYLVEWIDLNRKIMKAGVQGFLSNGTAGMADAIQKDGNAAWEAYDNYCLQRDAYEYVYRSPDLGQVFKMGDDFFEAVLMAKSGPELARQRAFMWRGLIGADVVTAIAKEVQTSLQPDNRALAWQNLGIALASHLAKTDRLAAVIALEATSREDKPDLLAAVKNEALWRHRNYDDEAIQRAWQRALEPGNDRFSDYPGWPSAMTLFQLLRLELPRGVTKDALLTEAPTAANAKYMLDLARKLLVEGTDAEIQAAENQLVKLSRFGLAEAAFLLSARWLEAGERSKTLRLLDESDLLQSRGLATELSRLKLTPEDQISVIAKLAEKSRGADPEALDQVAQCALLILKHDPDAGLGILFGLPVSVWQNRTMMLPEVYSRTTNPKFRSEILNFYLQKKDDQLWAYLGGSSVVRIDTRTWQATDGTAVDHASRVQLSLDLLDATLRIPNGPLRTRAQVALYAYVAALGAPADWRRLGEMADGFDDKQREDISKDTWMYLQGPETRNTSFGSNIAIATARMVRGILEAGQQPQDIRALINLCSLDPFTVLPLVADRLQQPPARTAVALQLIRRNYGEWRRAMSMLGPLAEAGYRPALLVAINALFDEQLAANADPRIKTFIGEFDWIRPQLAALAKKEPKVWREAYQEVDNFLLVAQYGMTPPIYDTRIKVRAPKPGGPLIAGQPRPSYQALLEQIYQDLGVPSTPAVSREKQAPSLSQTGPSSGSQGTASTDSSADVPPKIVRQVAPVYPVELLREGVTGKVAVQFIVTTDGMVAEAVVVKSTRQEFEAAAIQAVRQWRFRPGIKSGKPVNVRISTVLEFNAHN